MLGQDLLTLLRRDGEEVAGYSRRDRDITDAAAVEAAVRERKPAVIVNCAAWTGVDDAEAHEDAALQVSGHAVAALATACADYGSTLVHMSTDTATAIAAAPRVLRPLSYLAGPAARGNQLSGNNSRG